MSDIPKTCKVMVTEEFNKPFVMKEVEIPEIGDGDILVKVQLAGTCGTDIHEHAGHIAKQITVYPYFGTIIDTVYLKPDDFVFIVFRYVKFRAEPIGVELASCFGKIWDDIPV